MDLLKLLPKLESASHLLQVRTEPQYFALHKVPSFILAIDFVFGLRVSRPGGLFVLHSFSCQTTGPAKLYSVLSESYMSAYMLHALKRFPGGVASSAKAIAG